MLSKSLKMAVAMIATAASASVNAAEGASFPFGSGLNNITGLESATLSNGGFELSLKTTPAGALLNEASSQGLGIDSRPVPGVSGSELDKFDVLDLDGGGNLAESITLSFDQAGFITEMDFDGVKDESLEYFTLTSPSGVQVHFFDSAANVSVPGAIDAAIQAGDLTGQVVFLLEERGVFDDEINGLAIPFAANEPLTLTYAELGAAYNPSESPNGARFEGISVSTVPEPASCLLLMLAACAPFRTRPSR